MRRLRRFLLVMVVLAGGIWLGWGEIRARWPAQALRIEVTLEPARVWLADTSTRISVGWVKIRDEHWPALRTRVAAWWNRPPSPVTPPLPSLPGATAAGNSAPAAIPTGELPRDDAPPITLPSGWEPEYGTAHASAAEPPLGTTRNSDPLALEDGSPEVGSPEVAGVEGFVLRSPNGIRLDLGPGCRYLRGNSSVQILAGQALLSFPEAGASLHLSSGAELEGAAAACEVYLDQEGGMVDLLAGELTLITRDRQRHTVLPMQRMDLVTAETEPYPSADAARFVKRLAWFLVGRSRERAPGLATQLTRRALASAKGSDREQPANRALAAALDW